MSPLLEILVDGPGYHGFLVIDSFRNERSSGGVRIAPSLTGGEVSALAREMTLKYCFFRLPRGGAKAGVSINGDVSADDRRMILFDFGRRLGPLIQRGVYYPGMDMNCGPEDLRTIYEGAGIRIGKVTDTGFFTAISVGNAIQAYRDAVGDSDRPCRLAIEGFGGVAGHLLGQLPADQYKVVALSTLRGAVINEDGFSAEELVECRRLYRDDIVVNLPGGTRAELDEVFRADVDVLVPSARTWVIDQAKANGIKAQAVVPISNAPYTVESMDVLHRRGILALPGFVTNAGGVFGSSMFDAGVPTDEIEFTAPNHYRELVVTLIREAGKMGVSPTDLATAVAEEDRGRFTGKTAGGLRQRIGMKLSRTVIPRSVSARRYFQRFNDDLIRIQERMRMISQSAETSQTSGD